MSAYPPKVVYRADIGGRLKSAIRRPEQVQQRAGSYSMTSSARASSVGGISRLSALAVLLLITSSYLVGP
jgi:hypothetical protein